MIRSSKEAETLLGFVKNSLIISHSGLTENTSRDKLNSILLFLH